MTHLRRKVCTRVGAQTPGHPRRLKPGSSSEPVIERSVKSGISCLLGHREITDGECTPVQPSRRTRANPACSAVVAVGQMPSCGASRGPTEVRSVEHFDAVFSEMCSQASRCCYADQ